MKKSRLIETQIVTILSTGHFPDPLPDRRPPPHSQHFLSLARVSDIFFIDVDARHRKAIVCLLLRQFSRFILQSALEALHPIEEDIDFDAGHYHAESADGPVSVIGGSHEGFVRVSASFLFCLNFSLGAAAQNTGAIEGTVTLPTGEPAHRVTVLVVELGRIIETDDDGDTGSIRSLQGHTMSWRSSRC